MENYMLGAKEIAEALNVSTSQAYKLIREINKELGESGYIVINGRIPKAFVEKKFYGYGVAESRS